MDEPSLENDVQEISPVLSFEHEKKKALVPGMEKILQLMPNMPSNTLLEKSAQALAEAWMRDNDAMPEFSSSVVQSAMGFIFKIQIAIYLQGYPLLQWIRSQNGLETIANMAWPDLFQKLLTTIFNELDRLDQRISIKNSLWYMLEDYKKHVQMSPDLQHTLHRLGLTNFFRQGKTCYQDNLMLFYYWYLEDRCPNFRGTLPMVYPLPFVLQCRASKIKDYRAAFYANSPAIKEKKQEWALLVTDLELEEENKGKSISKKTLQQQKSLYQAYCENYTPSERFMSCISVMARNQVNGAYPVVLVAALLSLVHPFYSGKHELDYPLLRMFRIDIFWFLSRALCTFYAQLDLPLACLYMAKKSIGPFPCLSERMRYALCFQTIAVNYGHWQAAAGIYDEWCNKVPGSSWLYEELVFNRIVELFWRMENLLVEMYINLTLHRECRKTCGKGHLHVSLLKLKHLNLKVLGIAYRCLYQTTTKQTFQDNMHIVLHLRNYFNITFLKLQKTIYLNNEQQRNNEFDESLKELWQKLERSVEFNTSRHLTPFMRILPYFVGSQYFWDNLIQNHMDNSKRMLESFSCVDTPKSYADRLFSLVVSMLYHHRHNSFSHVIQATLQAYLKCSAGRHYRIPLLRKLLQVYTNPTTHQLTIEPLKEDPHSEVPPEEVSAIGMTLKDIEAFSITARDARNDFANQDFSNDEKFIMYMKHRDPLMAAWIDLGLDGLRFADCL